MKALLIEVQPVNSEECVALIEQYYLSGNWKRLHKITYKGCCNIISVRTYGTSNNEFCTLVVEEDGNTKLFPDLDFRTCVTLVKEVLKVAKSYWTHDYGDLFFNPYELAIWAVGGDGGWIYSTLSKSEFKKAWDKEEISFDTQEVGYVEINEHPNTKAIKSVTWEAESPPDEDEDTEYFCIGRINEMDF